jgi:hypothetical protein
VDGRCFWPLKAFMALCDAKNKVCFVAIMCISLLKLSLHTQVICFSQVLTRLAISKYGTLAGKQIGVCVS